MLVYYPLNADFQNQICSVKLIYDGATLCIKVTVFFINITIHIFLQLYECYKIHIPNVIGHTL